MVEKLRRYSSGNIRSNIHDIASQSGMIKYNKHSVFGNQRGFHQDVTQKLNIERSCHVRNVYLLCSGPLGIFGPVWGACW